VLGRGEIMELDEDPDEALAVILGQAWGS